MSRMRGAWVGVALIGAGCALAAGCGSDDPAGNPSPTGGAANGAGGERTIGAASTAGGDSDAPNTAGRGGEPGGAAMGGVPAAGGQGAAGEGGSAELPVGGASSGAGGASSGAGGAGGASSGAGGAGGAPAETYPAPHAGPPQLKKNPGSVLAHPKLVPIFFSNENTTRRSELTAFFNALPNSSYWKAVTEYGVGSGSTLAPVVLGSAPSGVTDAEIQTLLDGDLKTGGILPVADASTLYVFGYPAATTVSVNGQPACASVGSYYSSMTSGALDVPYVVLPSCGAEGDLSAAEVDTVLGGAVVLAAATDPHPIDDPAWADWDDEHRFWGFVFGADIRGDCSADQGSLATFSGLPNLVQRVWSNQSAANGHDPCLPIPVGMGAYFNAVPVLPDTTNALGVTSQTVKIPVGQTRVIDVQLFSDGPTSGPWQVSVSDGAELAGQAAQLSLLLDKSAGSNGDTLKLTIKALQAGAFGSSFVVFSTLGNVSHHWDGFVSN